MLKKEADNPLSINKTRSPVLWGLTTRSKVTVWGFFWGGGISIEVEKLRQHQAGCHVVLPLYIDVQEAILEAITCSIYMFKRQFLFRFHPCPFSREERKWKIYCNVLRALKIELSEWNLGCMFRMSFRASSSHPSSNVNRRLPCDIWSGTVLHLWGKWKTETGSETRHSHTWKTHWSSSRPWSEGRQEEPSLWHPCHIQKLFARCISQLQSFHVYLQKRCI